MFLYILLVFVIQNGVFSTHKDYNWNSLKQTSEFIKIINKVLNTGKYDKFFYVDLESKDIPLDQDYYEVNDKISGKEVVKTENEKAHTLSANGVRLHLIKNPDVLYRYQKKIAERLKSVNYNPSKRKSKAAYIQDILADIRRNAVYRLDKTSGESNNVNEDQSLENNQPSHKSQRKRNMDFDDKLHIKLSVAPLIFITEEPNKAYDRTRDTDNQKKGDLPKWDDIQYPDYKNTKSKAVYEDDKVKSKDDGYQSNKEFSFKKTEDRTYNDDYKSYKSSNDVYKPKKDKYKPYDDYKTNKDKLYDDYKPKKDKYKPYDDYKPNKNSYNDDHNYKHKKDNYKPYDDYKPIKSNYKPYDDYKPYNKNYYDTYKPKNDKYKTENKGSYYKHPIVKKVERSGGGVAFGRTPIPYKGKKSVYEEK